MADKVELLEVTTDPSPPVTGKPITVKLKVKGNCPSGTQQPEVAAELRVGDQKLGPGRVSLNGEEAAEVAVAWKQPALGSHTISVELKGAEEEGAALENNRKSLEVSVQPGLVTRVLEPEKAKEAGAQLPYSGGSIYAERPCEVSFGEVTAKDLGPNTLKAELDCSKFNRYAAGPGLAGFKAYEGFRLKNGWVLTKYAVSNCFGSQYITGLRNALDVEIRSKTFQKSNDPYFVVSLHLESGQRGMACVKLWIEGLDGTDPYK